MNRGIDVIIIRAPLLLAALISFSSGDVAQIPPVENLHFGKRGAPDLTMSAVTRSAVRRRLGFQVLSWTAAIHKLPCLCSNRRRNIAPALRRIETSVRMTSESDFDQKVSYDLDLDTCLGRNLMVKAG